MTLFKKKKLSFASTEQIDLFRPQVDLLLLAIAKYMVDEGDSLQDWADYTFVSDESSLADFLVSEEDLLSLAADLNAPELHMRSLIWKVAAALKLSDQENV